MESRNLVVCGSGSASGSAEDDTASDDGLWPEFENSATAIAHLFRGANWKNLQAAAMSTTQLYKVGLETKKRSFERGFQSGRQALAKEVFALCRPYCSKIEVEDVVKLLSRYAPPPTSFHPSAPHHHYNEHHAHTPASPIAHRHHHRGVAADPAGGVNLFQEVLCPISSSPPPPSSQSHHRSQSELNQFLQTQAHRHRKRAHPGGSPASTNERIGDQQHSEAFFTSSSSYPSKRTKYL